MKKSVFRHGRLMPVIRRFIRKVRHYPRSRNHDLAVGSILPHDWEWVAVSILERKKTEKGELSAVVIEIERLESSGTSENDALPREGR
jgi:hypothetical protein